MSELSRKARGILSNHVGVFRGIGATIDGLCDEVEALEKENARLRLIAEHGPALDAMGRGVGNPLDRLENENAALKCEIEELRNRLSQIGESPKPKPINDGVREIRIDQDGALDEVIVRDPTSFHMESMGEGDWWMRIYAKDDRDVVINFHCALDPSVEIDGPAHSDSALYRAMADDPKAYTPEKS